MLTTQKNTAIKLISGYRYSFQGQEKDDEIKGEGNSINYTYRMHDPRVGRFFAVDPLAREYPYSSTYSFSENRVVDGIDLEGLEYYYTADGTLIGQVGFSTEVMVVNADANLEEVRTNIANLNNLHEKGNFVEKRFGLTDSEIISYRKSSEFMASSSTSTGMTLEEINYRAFLTTIRQAENSSSSEVSDEPLGYNVNYGGGTFTSYDDHPQNSITKGGYTSDAAGAYQIMGDTWNDVCVPVGGYTDFTPQTQDQAAILLIEEQEKWNHPKAVGVTSNISTGNVLTAAKQLNGTWTSLPGGPQEKMTDSQFMDAFKQNFVNELNGNTEVATPQGQLSTP